MRQLILIASLFAQPVFAQPELPLPLLYTVTGVAQNDTLNLRESPDASAPDMGDLRPEDTVEILRLSADGKWGRVESYDAVGWVSMRFMALTPNTTADGTGLPYGLPLQISCSGAEPFWDISITSGNEITIGSDGTTDWEVNTYPILGISKTLFTSEYVYGFSSPPYTGVLKKEACFNDFTGLNSGWTLALVFQQGRDNSVLSGCCTATLN